MSKTICLLNWTSVSGFRTVAAQHASAAICSACADHYSLLNCPSDGGPQIFEVVTLSGSGPIEQYAGNSYHMNLGSGVGTNYDTRLMTDGILWTNSKVSSAQSLMDSAIQLRFPESLRGREQTNVPAPVNNQEKRRTMVNVPCVWTSTSIPPTVAGLANGFVTPIDLSTYESRLLAIRRRVQRPTRRWMDQRSRVLQRV